MEKVKSKNPKRKAESGSEADQSESKRPREWNCQLLDLSDDVLLMILSYVGTPALLSVSDVCTRLLQISSDASLWERIDTTAQPMKVNQFRKLLKFMSNRTTSVSIGGDVHDVSITPSLLESISIKCPMLEEFVLDGCCIDAERYVCTYLLDIYLCRVIRLGKTGSLGPWSRVIVCCSKLCFCQNDSHIILEDNFGKSIACYNKP